MPYPVFFVQDEAKLFILEQAPFPPKCIPSDNRFTSLFLLPIFVDMLYLWHTQITKNDKVSDGQEVMHSILIQALSCVHVLESVKALTLHAED